MITQQQRKELTLAAVDCEHQINADCIRLWRDPTKEGTALAQLMDRIEAKVRQYIEQGAQPGADVVMVPRASLKAWKEAFDIEANEYLPDTLFHVDKSRAEIAAFLSAAPQPQQEQEQSK